MEPYLYMAMNPGKGVPAKIIAACNSWLNVPKEQLEVITNVAVMLHHASLMYRLAFALERRIFGLK